MKDKIDELFKLLGELYPIPPEGPDETKISLTKPVMFTSTSKVTACITLQYKKENFE